jgi:hypothetical protein
MNLVLCEKCGTVYSNAWCPTCRKAGIENKKEHQNEPPKKPIHKVRNIVKETGNGNQT